MSIEPVVGDESDPYAIRKSDLPAIMDEYDKLAKIMIERETLQPRKSSAISGFTIPSSTFPIRNSSCPTNWWHGYRSPQGVTARYSVPEPHPDSLF